MKRWWWPLLLLPVWPGCKEEVAPALPRLVISELMYHPVLEPESDEHEFLEIENAGSEAVDLGGVRLTGGVRFAFPAGKVLPPGGFLVVARRRARLLEVYGSLEPARVVGDYAGTLGNDGDTVTLEKDVNGQGRVLDRVSYDDAFPWPLGADALGAAEGWLPPEQLPLTAHRFRGRSLERRSATHAGTDPANWSASPLDGATPGGPPAERGEPLPTVRELATSSGGAVSTAVLTPMQPIEVRVTFAPDTARAPAIEYWVDDQINPSPARTRVALARRGDQAGARVASLPAFPAGTLLRYRVVDDDNDVVALSPRASDPARDYPLYVGSLPAGKTPAYQLLIGKAQWEHLWDNIIDGRVPLNVAGGNPLQCEVNPRWDERVSAVLVAGTQVFDVRARYQGSRVNRFSGPRPFDPSKWLFDKTVPSAPGEPLSWHFNLPRYARLEGKRRFKFSKLPDSSCQGFFSRVGNTLFEMAGVPASQTQYARLYINGRYYHYMQRMEHVDEDLLKRHFGPDVEVGDLFKSDGARWDEGPYGWGDERLLEGYCGYSAEERYDATYERQTWEDERPGSDDVRVLLEDMHAARAAGIPALRAHFEKFWDMPRLASYMAIKNWLGAWDDVWQNHYLYRQADGRWMILPTDLDNHFGFAAPSATDASFFSGVDNGRSNYRELTNYLKDSYLRAFREEHIARLRELAQNILHPTNVIALIDEAAADYVVDEAREAPAGLSTSAACGAGDPAVTVARMKAFVRARHERVLDGLFD
jgi:hypothetical protein